MILESWVRSHSILPGSMCPHFKILHTDGHTSILILEALGVIPRAATALFEKLSGPPALIRNGSSGLRSPTRYSTNSVHTLQSLSKSGLEKGWQMKATYVEVCIDLPTHLLV